MTTSGFCDAVNSGYGILKKKKKKLLPHSLSGDILNSVIFLVGIFLLRFTFKSLQTEFIHILSKYNGHIKWGDRTLQDFSN